MYFKVPKLLWISLQIKSGIFLCKNKFINTVHIHFEIFLFGMWYKLWKCWAFAEVSSPLMLNLVKINAVWKRTFVSHSRKFVCINNYIKLLIVKSIIHQTSPKLYAISQTVIIWEITNNTNETIRLVKLCFDMVLQYWLS